MGIVHRDVKPHNIMIDLETRKVCYGISLLHIFASHFQVPCS